MVEFERMILTTSVYSDGHMGGDETVPTYGGGEGSYLVSFADMCQQFNFTVDDKDDKQIGYTPRVILGPKCFSTQRPLDFVYEKYNDTFNIS